MSDSSKIIYQSNNHKFIWLGADKNEEKGIIQTNQYLIIHNGKGVLLDPGGLHIFSKVVSAASQYISMDNIEAIFFSHQDPDVSSGISLWLGITSAQIYISSLWKRFLPHFGLIDNNRIIGIDNKTQSMNLQGASLEFIPSHFMHSVGCYSLFDPESKILFSGDIGAADINYTKESLYVENFNLHKQSLEAFHTRYMSSQSVCARWVSLVERKKPYLLAPQHGPLFQDEILKQFLFWLSNLRCGIDLLDDLYN